MDGERHYAVGRAAALARVSVRTLHHYDEIGLLRPSARSAAGYRLYTAADLRRLHRILLCRQLGFPLEEIARLLDDPTFDLAAALRERRARVAEELRRARAVARAVDAALAVIENGDVTEVETMFEGFDSFDEARLAAEAEERWGDTEAWRESKRRTRQYGSDDWEKIRAEGEALVAEMAALKAAGAAAGDAGPREVAERHRRHIDRWFYPCSPTVHAGLADLYVTDPRFAANFDRAGEGMAVYFAAAVRANAAAATD